MVVTWAYLKSVVGPFGGSEFGLGIGLRSVLVWRC